MQSQKIRLGKNHKHRHYSQRPYYYYGFGSPTFRIGNMILIVQSNRDLLPLNSCNVRKPTPCLGVGATPRFGRTWARRFK